MKGDALYRVIGGLVLVAFAIVVAAVKFHASGGIGAVLSADPVLIVGCAAIALLGVLVTADGVRSQKRIAAMTRLIGSMANEKNLVATAEIAATVGVHETEVRERVDEMIKGRLIGSGTRIVYTGGEKVVR
jgi:hypothetical protein